MIPPVHLLIGAFCVAVLAAGCGGGDAPMEPEPEPQRTTLTLDFAHIEVIEDCDGIEGDGDFKFHVLVTGTMVERAEVLFSETVNLGPGGKSRTIGRRSYTLDATGLPEVVVGFRASEMDRTILGEEYGDDRLDNDESILKHEFVDGAWSDLGLQSITLGSSGCMVRLFWTASAETP